MADIHIHRDHTLGLTRARKVAWKWAEHVEQKFEMECTVLEGETSDTVQFKRSGVSGTMIVTADHFQVDAKLGLLLGAFAGQIQGEVSKQLDEALAKEQAKAAKKV
ncbi:polyhydroxyalkanoic acid system family protein [Ideonella sp.]|uniref:polyhydroxyalkanoic acid system family protein n=1 Tax=Ideonella sp. TaxID=1929293 RepID=UPI002B4768C5|nr:polyhydroxyalkanoic acid system family protein [Ideonella sp.]HJV68301.1 polyhydroxyalkanoic acid system family protein [Ideonella sp.]